MFRITTSLLLGLTAVLGSDDEHVAVLTSANFTDFIEKNPLTLVEFYAPWCGHCKNLEPHFNESGHSLHQKKAKSKLAKVDATAETDLASEYGISGYPTLKYFVDGKQEEYNGPREAKGITEWLLKREKPNVKKLRNEAAATEWLQKQTDNSAVAYIHGRKHEGVFRRAVAQLMDEAETFAYVPIESPDDERLEIHRLGSLDRSAVIQAEEPTTTLKGFKNFETGKKIKNQLEMARFPLIGAGRKFSAAMYPYSQTRNVAIAVIPLGSSAEVEQKVIDALLPAALKMKDKIHISLAFEGEANLGQVAELLGTSESPELIILDRRHGLAAFEASRENIRPVKYRLTGADSKGLTDSAALERFFSEWESGKAEKYLKEQKKSASHDSFGKDKDPNNVIHHLIASEVDKKMFESENDGKDFFILYYAPWCGHCKAMKNDYVKLAEQLQREGQKNIVIAAMDATANDVGIEQISGYPSIIYYPAAHGRDKRLRNKVTYQGQRQKKEMYDFIQAASEVWIETALKSQKHHDEL